MNIVLKLIRRAFEEPSYQTEDPNNNTLGSTQYEQIYKEEEGLNDSTIGAPMEVIKESKREEKLIDFDDSPPN